MLGVLLTALLATANPTDLAKAEVVLANAERTPSVELFLASVALLEQKRNADAAFLFFAAQLRSRYDLNRYPPKGTGGDSPDIAIGALSGQIGAAVNPAIMRQPKELRAVVDRIAKFTPATPRGYDPGWEHKRPASEKEALMLFNEQRAEFLTLYRGMVTLLEDPEYFAAFRTVQDYNFAPFEETRKPERIRAKDEAVQKMLAIEKKLDIEGMFHRK